MTDKEIYAEALLDLAPDLDGDHRAEPTVVVLGDVPTYEDKVPDGYSEVVSGKQVDEYEGVPVIQFSPRFAHVEDNGLSLKDGHLGGSRDYDDDLPAEFEHFIERYQYVAAAIYQESVEDSDDVRVTDTGSVAVDD